MIVYGLSNSSIDINNLFAQSLTISTYGIYHSACVVVLDCTHQFDAQNLDCPPVMPPSEGTGYSKTLLILECDTRVIIHGDSLMHN